jgi:hypothetical protein
MPPTRRSTACPRCGRGVAVWLTTPDSAVGVQIVPAPPWCGSRGRCGSSRKEVLPNMSERSRYIRCAGRRRASELAALHLAGKEKALHHHLVDVLLAVGWRMRVCCSRISQHGHVVRSNSAVSCGTRRSACHAGLDAPASCCSSSTSSAQAWFSRSRCPPRCRCARGLKMC